MLVQKTPIISSENIWRDWKAAAVLYWASQWCCCMKVEPCRCSFSISAAATPPRVLSVTSEPYWRRSFTTCTTQTSKSELSLSLISLAPCVWSGFCAAHLTSLGLETSFLILFQILIVWQPTFLSKHILILPHSVLPWQHPVEVWPHPSFWREHWLLPSPALQLELHLPPQRPRGGPSNLTGATKTYWLQSALCFMRIVKRFRMLKPLRLTWIIFSVDADACLNQQLGLCYVASHASFMQKRLPGDTSLLNVFGEFKCCWKCIFWVNAKI